MGTVGKIPPHATEHKTLTSGVMQYKQLNTGMCGTDKMHVDLLATRGGARKKLVGAKIC
jgi:hypothetical protein